MIEIIPFEYSNEIEFGRPFKVAEHGFAYVNDNMAPESLHVWYNTMGKEHVYEDHGQGWCPLSGYTGQYGYNGPVMRPSELFAGGIVDDIRDPDMFDTSARFVLCTVHDLNTEEDEDDMIGWAIMYHD